MLAGLNTSGVADDVLHIFTNTLMRCAFLLSL